MSTWEDERRALRVASDALRRKHGLPVPVRAEDAAEAWNYMDSLVSQIEEAVDGAACWNRGSAPDKAAAIERKLRRALDLIDVAIEHVKQQRGQQ